MRKLGFYIKQPTIVEYCSLIIIFSIEILLFNYRKQESSYESIKILGGVIFMILWWITISTPLSERLRNIYVIAIWLIICVVWLEIKEGPTSILPLFVLIYSQVCRLIFKTIYKYEPIPLLAHWYPIHRFSAIEKRQSDKKDFYFSFICFIIGGSLSVLIGIST